MPSQTSGHHTTWAVRESTGVRATFMLAVGPAAAASSHPATTCGEDHGGAANPSQRVRPLCDVTRLASAGIVEASFSFSLLPLTGGLTVLVLAWVFQRGVRLQRPDRDEPTVSAATLAVK